MLNSINLLPLCPCLESKFLIVTKMFGDICNNLLFEVVKQKGVELEYNLNCLYHGHYNLFGKLVLFTLGTSILLVSVVCETFT